MVKAGVAANIHFPVHGTSIMTTRSSFINVRSKTVIPNLPLTRYIEGGIVEP